MRGPDCIIAKFTIPASYYSNISKYSALYVALICVLLDSDSTLMCTQIVFSVLDHLTAWTNDKRRAISVRKVKGHPQRSKLVNQLW